MIGGKDKPTTSNPKLWQAGYGQRIVKHKKDCLIIIITFLMRSRSAIFSPKNVGRRATQRSYGMSAEFMCRSVDFAFIGEKC